MCHRPNTQCERVESVEVPGIIDKTLHLFVRGRAYYHLFIRKQQRCIKRRFKILRTSHPFFYNGICVKRGEILVFHCHVRRGNNTRILMLQEFY